MSLKQSLLFVNLGTPAAPQAKEVRSYLKEFLSDPRVIDISTLGRLLLLYGVILPFRPKKSAEAYQKIWTTEGSPLLTYSERFVTKVHSKLSEFEHILLAMRYGEPSLKRVLSKLSNSDSITVFPLYPQYASASTGSTLEVIYRYLSERWNVPAIKVMPPFYGHTLFIRALASSVKRVKQTVEWDHLLMSYHGLPLRQVKKSEIKPNLQCERGEPCPKMTDHNRYCYRAQCYETSRLLAQELGLSSDEYSVSFQSRLGRTPWIKPYTDVLLEDLIKQGKRRLAVICPSFVADCLETLEEIKLRLSVDWKKLGGEALILIPCLNDNDDWVDAVVKMIEEV